MEFEKQNQHSSKRYPSHENRNGTMGPSQQQQQLLLQYRYKDLISSGNIYSDEQLSQQQYKNFPGIMQSFSADSVQHMRSQDYMDTQNIESRYLMQNDASLTNKNTIQTNVKSQEFLDQELPPQRTQPISPSKEEMRGVTPHHLSSEGKSSKQGYGSKQRCTQKNSQSLGEGELSTSICTYMQSKQQVAAQQLLSHWKNQGYDPKSLPGGLSTVLSQDDPTSSNITAQQTSYLNQYDATKASDNINQNNTKFLSQENTNIFSDHMKIASNDISYQADDPHREERRQPSNGIPLPFSGQDTLGTPSEMQIQNQHQYFSQEDQFCDTNGNLQETSEYQQRALFSERNQFIKQFGSHKNSQLYTNQSQTQVVSKNLECKKRSKISTTQDSSTAWGINSRQQNYLLQKIDENNEYLGSKVGMQTSQRTASYDNTFSQRSAINMNPSSNSQRRQDRRARNANLQTEESKSSPSKKKRGKKERAITTPACRDRLMSGYELNNDHLALRQNARSQLPLLRCQSQSNQLDLQNQEQRQRYENFQTFERKDQIISTHRSSNYTSKFEQGKRNGLTARSLQDDVSNLRKKAESSYKVINGNQLINVSAEDPTSIINSGRRGVSDSNKSDSQHNDEESPQVDSKRPGLSPVTKNHNNIDSIDIGNPSVINVLQRKNEMNEDSFVDLLDHSTLQIEQRRQSNIYQGLRPVSSTYLDKNNGKVNTSEGFESEYMHNRMNLQSQNQFMNIAEIDTVQQQTTQRSGSDSKDGYGEQYPMYDAGQGTVKMNAVGSMGNTNSYNTGYSGGIGLQTLGTNESQGTGTRCQPSSLISTSKLVEQQAQRIIHQEINQVTDQSAYQSHYGQQIMPSSSSSQLLAFPSFKQGQQPFRQNGSRERPENLNRNYSFAPTQRQSNQIIGRQKQNLISDKVEQNATLDSREQRYLDEPSSQMLESQDQEGNNYDPSKQQQPRSILKNSTNGSKKSLSQNEHSRDKIHDVRYIDDFQDHTASGTNQLGKSFKGLDATSSLSQGHFQANIQGNTFQSQSLTCRGGDTHTLSNSMLPPKGNNKNAITDILKQELLSCKRQLKDQQTSNQFLKKEKFKIEHEKNMLQIQYNQQQGRMQEIEQENSNMHTELEQASNQKHNETDKSTGYINQLKKMNELQAKENIILVENSLKSEQRSRDQVEELQRELGEKKKKDQREQEKLISKLLQLASAAEHLKDIVKLAQVGKDEQETQQKMINYIELNFEGTIKNLIRLMQSSDKQKQSTSSLDRTNSLEHLFDSSKLEVRALNFKKFRESTKTLINHLCEGQLKSKKLVISNLETSLINAQNDSKTKLQESKQKVHDLNQKLESSQKAQNALKIELDRFKSETIPQMEHLKEQLQSQGRQIKQDMQKQYMIKEEDLQDKLIKQKYQIKEHHEKEKMLKNENTEHKIQIESMRFQISNLQKDQNQRAARGKSEVRTTQRTWSGLQDGNRSNSIDDSAIMLACNKTSAKGFLIEKYKNQKLKHENEKQVFYHSQEKSLMQTQIDEYKDTVQTQAALIHELQRKLQQKHTQNNSMPTYEAGNSQLRYRTTQPSTHDLSIPNFKKSNFQSQGQFLYISDQQQQQPYMTYQEDKENRAFQNNNEQFQTQQVQYLDDNGYQTIQNLPQFAKMSSGISEIQQQQTMSAPQQQSNVEQQAIMNNQPQFEPIVRSKQRYCPSGKISGRIGLVQQHQNSKVPSSQSYLLYEQTKSKTQSEDSELNNIEATPAQAQVMKAQEQVHSTLQNLLKSRQERQNKEQQRINNQEEDDEDDEEATSNLLTSPPNVIDESIAGEEKEVCFNNQYLNIENVKAENFESLDSEQINSRNSQMQIKQGQVSETAGELQQKIGQLQIKLRGNSVQSSYVHSIYQTDKTVSGMKSPNVIDEEQYMELQDTNSQDSYNKDTIPLQSPSAKDQLD